jgi:hypothetical protein
MLPREVGAQGGFKKERARPVRAGWVESFPQHADEPSALLPSLSSTLAGAFQSPKRRGAATRLIQSYY